MSKNEIKTTTEKKTRFIGLKKLREWFKESSIQEIIIKVVLVTLTSVFTIIFGFSFIISSIELCKHNYLPSSEGMQYFVSAYSISYKLFFILGGLVASFLGFEKYLLTKRNNELAERKEKQKTKDELIVLRLDIKTYINDKIKEDSYGVSIDQTISNLVNKYIYFIININSKNNLTTQLQRNIKELFPEIIQVFGEIKKSEFLKSSYNYSGEHIFFDLVGQAFYDSANAHDGVTSSFYYDEYIKNIEADYKKYLQSNPTKPI